MNKLRKNALSSLTAASPVKYAELILGGQNFLFIVIPIDLLIFELNVAEKLFCSLPRPKKAPKTFAPKTSLWKLLAKFL